MILFYCVVAAFVLGRRKQNPTAAFPDGRTDSDAAPAFARVLMEQELGWSVRW